MKRVPTWLKFCGILLLCVLLLTGYCLLGARQAPRMANPQDGPLPADAADAILAVETGFYSEKLPIFARKIEILEASGDRILYQVSYFPFGSIQRSYSLEPNGSWMFNLEKPLTGI